MNQSPAYGCAYQFLHFLVIYLLSYTNIWKHWPLYFFWIVNGVTALFQSKHEDIILIYYDKTILHVSTPNALPGGGGGGEISGLSCESHCLISVLPLPLSASYCIEWYQYLMLYTKFSGYHAYIGMLVVQVGKLHCIKEVNGHLLKRSVKFCAYTCVA